MLEWYKTVFDARVQYEKPAIAFLTFDDEHHRFAIANLEILQPGGTREDRQSAIGVDHIGYTYPSLRALLENYELLKARGIKPYWSIHHGITAAPCYADPDEWLKGLRPGIPEQEFLVRKTHAPVSPLRGAFAQIVGQG